MMQEHAWFASSRFPELVDMLIDLQSPVDTSSQRSRFGCFHILLVHSLKVRIYTIFSFNYCFWFLKFFDIFFGFLVIYCVLALLLVVYLFCSRFLVVIHFWRLLFCFWLTFENLFLVKRKRLTRNI